MSSTSDPGRDAQKAVLLTHAWRDEIETAIDRAKQFRTRSANDNWFRKMWYKAGAKNRKRWERGCGRG